MFEAAKGALVLMAGLGVFALLHHGSQQGAEQLVKRFHLNPAGGHPRIFLQLADVAAPARLLPLAVAALAYSVLRFAEAYGLWHDRAWAAWVALISGGIYLPIEIWEFRHGFAWPLGFLFAVNLGIVVYLARVLQRRSRGPNDRTTRT